VEYNGVTANSHSLQLATQGAISISISTCTSAAEKNPYSWQGIAIDIPNLPLYCTSQTRHASDEPRRSSKEWYDVHTQLQYMDDASAR
jgi:hypothetical protein